MTVVLDASVALGWIFERANATQAARATAIVDGLREQPALVPALWHVEILNALVVGQRKGVITAAKSVDFLARLARLPIETDDAVPPHREHVYSLALEHRLSAYDAMYLELAIRHRRALATFDQRLAQVCGSVGVPVA